MFFCIGTEGSNGSLFRSWCFTCISMYLGTEGSKSSLLRNGWFQCFSVMELKVPLVPYLEVGVSHVFLFRN